ARAQYPLDILGVKNVARELPGGIILSTFDLAQIASAVALYLALFVFFRFSRLGIQMRAAAENPLLAAQRGINIHLLFALSWSIATFTAAAAGVLYASNIRLDPGIADIGLKALAVPLAGGMGSLLGAIPAAIVIAGAEIITIRGISGLWTGNPLLSNVMPFIIILIVMLLRPWGILGKEEEIERV
ncbi:MAG TPA: branched-chain amino acid ABC transporter permease, partial [Dehalococcoidia bacterium]|nr:branched-chain amino acid ABC transporter permease [Dehalococcoidia bacterium]